MDTTESLGYLKGLLDGMDLDESKKETKIYRAMIGVLENLAEDVNDLTDGVEMMADQLDAVDEDLGDVEEYLYGDEDDDVCTAVAAMTTRTSARSLRSSAPLATRPLW